MWFVVIVACFLAWTILDNNGKFWFMWDLGEKKERCIDLYTQHKKLHLATTVTFLLLLFLICGTGVQFKGVGGGGEDKLEARIRPPSPSLQDQILSFDFGHFHRVLERPSNGDEAYRMIFANICEHASSAFIFVSTSRVAEAVQFAPWKQNIDAGNNVSRMVKLKHWGNMHPLWRLWMSTSFPGPFPCLGWLYEFFWKKCCSVLLTFY